MVRISIWVTNLISYLWSPEDGCWLTAMSGGQQLMTLYGIHAKIALVTCLNYHLPKKVSLSVVQSHPLPRVHFSQHH